MKSSLFARLLPKGLLVGTVLLTTSASCVQDQEFLIVDRAIFFDGTECTITGSEPSPVNFTVDVAFDGQIAMGFALQNLSIPNTLPADGGSNTNIDDSEIVIEEADVVLSFSGGGLAESTFTLPLPSNSINGGEEVYQVVAVPSSVASSLRDTMSALPAGTIETLEMEVTFKGRKAGQVGTAGRLGAVNARPYTYPFQVCFGCQTVCVEATACGGEEGDPPVCPGASLGEYATSCGYLGGLIYPVCGDATLP